MVFKGGEITMNHNNGSDDQSTFRIECLICHCTECTIKPDGDFCPTITCLACGNTEPY